MNANRYHVKRLYPVAESGSAPHVPDAMRLKLIMCNLQFGIGTTRGYWQYLTTGWKYYLPHASSALPAAARFIHEQAPDVVALCEVEHASRRSQWLDQPQWLSEHGAMPHCLFWPTLNALPSRRQGNALLSRYTVEAVANHRLPGEGEPRFLSEARLRLKRADVRFLVTHLSLDANVRQRQIACIADIVSTSDLPTLLTGDFNIKHESELEVLQTRRLAKAPGMPTFPSWRPGRVLDHLFFSAHFELVSQAVFRDYLFSDHLPLVAELSFSPANAEQMAGT